MAIAGGSMTQPGQRPSMTRRLAIEEPQGESRSEVVAVGHGFTKESDKVALIAIIVGLLIVVGLMLTAAVRMAG